MSPAYTALRKSAAWIDLSGRGKIRLTGDDRARLLHALTTNHVQQLKPGEGCYTFFLNAQGRILADANILCFEDHFLLDTEPETRQKLVEHLDRYIIADDVTVQDQTDRIVTIAVEGPEAATFLSRIGAPIPEAPCSTAVWRGPAEIMGGPDNRGGSKANDERFKVVARINTTGSGGFFVFAPVDEKEQLIARLGEAGVAAASAEEARIVRIENGRPRYSEEITERYLVQETDQLHAVHFSKGCYLGQEIVERVRSRAHIHRVLRRLEIDSDAVPEPGTKLKAGDADAAEIASAAFSPSLGKTVALAYVKTTHAEPGSELSLGDVRARVT